MDCRESCVSIPHVSCESMSSVETYVYAHAANSDLKNQSPGTGGVFFTYIATRNGRAARSL